jgi:hypothetical protein
MGPCVRRDDVDCSAFARDISNHPPCLGIASRSRGTMRPSCATAFRPNRRAQGMPGAHCARSLVCRMKKHTSIVTTVTPGSPGIPRAMVLTVSFVLSPATGLFCHRRPQDHHLTSLTPASGRHDHTTSPSARSALVRCATCVHRIPPRVRDDREPPLCGTGPNRNNPASTPVSSEIRKIRSHIAGIFSEYFRAGARQEICKTAPSGQISPLDR